MKLIRWILFYLLFYVVCSIVAAIALDGLSEGRRALFILLMPIVLVWWQERRRDAKPTEPDPVPLPAIATPTDTPAPQQASRFLDVQRDGPLHSTPAATSASPPVRPSRSHQGWLPAGRTIVIAGRDIGGMVYVGTPPQLTTRGFAEKCRAYIDPANSVAPAGTDPEGHGLSYWPGYSTISSVCRATYLDWLTGGRSDGSVNPGYMFLYFYGLERRFFVDEPEAEEKQLIVAEVERLKALFASNHSVQRYLGEFLDLARISAAGRLSTDDATLRQSILDNRSWDLPLTLKIAIGGAIASEEALSADWLYVWFLCHYEKRLRTPAQRCESEFRALFGQKFDARFPDGLKVTKPRTRLDYRYQAASGEFGGTVQLTANEKPIPDISGLRKPIEIAQEIADEAMDALDKLSRYLGRNPDGRNSLEGHALLPAELRPLFPSSEMDALKDWIADLIAAGGLVPVTDLLARLEGAHSETASKRQLTGAADALARLGCGMAPDPRHSLRAPRIDEPVVLFDLGDMVEGLEYVSGAYLNLLFEIALATFIAQADKKLVEAERRSLKTKVAKAPGISDRERRALAANLDWYFAVPPDMALLRGKLKQVDTEHHVALRAALVAIAHADSVIQSEEVATIEKIYRALGLDPGLVYSDLHAGSDDGPVRVKAAEAGAPGEPIPGELAAKSARLDAARIAAIRTDTQRVSAVLGDIFSAEAEAETGNAADAPGPAAAAQWSGLDAKHRSFAEQIIVRAHWSEEDFARLAAVHGLMPSGALETINEWSFDRFDAALFDEYEGYDVAQEIAAALKADAVKEMN
ncbi:putative tellurite resistance protein B-like protein [Sphingopyxis sp. OAS728]|uniref:tellurite resistance TerB family protein n=1 Tax=Sphingopyxis sp. OAS728 TaxID=2663823 RepID=UPI001789E8AD|nr:TerB N-terminal domain-containing protein [Sphingopyxis sp. OAS728]MBE1529539.1 putative tellurite resistance protein B-like protein [Sphingopyxis sp. OAS728]